MAVQYDQPNMVTNNPTNFRQIPFSGCRGIASTKNVTDARTQTITKSLRRVAAGDNKSPDFREIL